MTDTDPRATDLPGSANADWGHPGRENAAEEQAGPRPTIAAESGWTHLTDADPQRRAGSHQGSADPADDLTANTTSAPAGDGEEIDQGSAPLPGDTLPGEGTVGGHPPSADVDALRTAERGREADAARADTSDATPTPRETPIGPA